MKKSIKKTIRKSLACVSFILVLCLILGVFSMVLKPKSNTKEAGFRHASAYSIVNEPSNTIDVLILGTSQAYCSFIPMEIWKNTGITSYVCSTPSQPLYYTEEFLHNAFENQTPELVVLETDALFEKFTDISILEHKLENASSLITYHSRWKELTAEDFSFSYDYSQRHLGKGFIYDYRNVSGINPNYMVPSDDVKQISEASIFYLERIIDFCREKNAKLVLVSAISASNWDYSKHNAVEAVARKYNIDYVDVNLMPEKIGLDWDKDWLDEGKHLNYYGAVKMTKWFSVYLQDFEFLSDKRILPEYNYWNEDAQQIDSEIPTE